SQVRPGRIADDTKTHRVEAEPVRVRDNPVDASADIVGDTWPDALLRCGKPVVQRDSDIPKAGEELAPPPVLLLRAGLEPSSVEHEHRGVIVTVDRGIDVGRENSISFMREADVLIDCQIRCHW